MFYFFSIHLFVLDSDITTEQEQDTNRETIRFHDSLEIQTKDIAQQTDFPPTPSTSGVQTTERKEPRGRQFVSSHKYLNEKGNSPKHPYEKTVFFVKSNQNGHVTQTGSNFKVPSTNTRTRPQSAVAKFNAERRSASARVDSGYGSHPETIRISQSPKSNISYQNQQFSNPGSAVSSPDRNASLGTGDKIIQPTTTNRLILDSEAETKPANMSYYTTDIISPISSARKQEKEDLQLLNDRFTTYIQKVRLLSEQNNRLDASTFVKQTRVLEEEVATLKTLYERELDVLR